MKNNYLPGPGSIAWQKNKPFLLFIISLVAILSLLKILFYTSNYHFIFDRADALNTWKDKIKLIKWSLLNDFFTVLLVNAPLLILLQVGRLAPRAFSVYLVLPVFIVLNSFLIILNLADVFYFPFHFQRANADLLFVLDHPFERLLHLKLFTISAIIICIISIIFFTWKLHTRLFRVFSSGKHCIISTLLLVLVMLLMVMNKNSVGKMLLPTYPLTELNSKELLMVQNSFHTFSYSLFRSGQEVPVRNYMPPGACDSLLPIRKTVVPYRTNTTQKNVVLFIMESVPYDFFDTGGKYKVAMPFFDSILEKSTFFNNAFCYAHESNKGITAILAGIPTLSDIPLYHSSFVNMPITPIGSALKKQGYQSFFLIGDDYDNFGFAKCAHWLGIDNYYSKEDIPGYRKLPVHTMGLQDEAVLQFMEQKITGINGLRFAVNYNISTHYPYDLPAGFTTSFPPGYTNPMKSMSYYDHSLQLFFNKAQTETWFQNTVFIFCSDHWLLPDDRRSDFNAISGYRIPIVIYDPADGTKKTIATPASQFDILGTILSVAGYKDSIISYGGNLFDNNDTGRVVFSRPNGSLYQAADNEYILGYNYSNDKAEFLYHYKTDKALAKNLLHDPDTAPVLDRLTQKIRAFLQKASLQYNRQAFR